MTIIEHGGDTIEAEAIEMELTEPILTVAQQEVNHLVLTIIEAQAIPSWMLMAITRIEILVRVTSQISKSFHLILNCVRMNYIHDNGYTFLVGSVYEIFQFFRCTESTACRKETAHVITEGAIIRMLLNRHDLDAVVAILDDARQNVLLELRVSSHLLSILSHTDVALIDQERSGLWLEVFFLPDVRLRIPNLGREYFGLLILHHSSCPSRDSLAFATFPMNFHLKEVAVPHCLLGEFQLPVSCAFYTLSTVLRGLLPIVEVTYQINVRGIRCPLTEDPSTSGLVQTKVLVTIGKVTQRLLSILGQLVHLPECMLMTSTDGIFIRFQVWVVLDEPNMFWCARFLS